MSLPYLTKIWFWSVTHFSLDVKVHLNHCLFGLSPKQDIKKNVENGL